MAPIGVLQLASWLEKHGHPTDVHDCLGPYAPAGIEANAEIALAGNPDLIGFSATTSRGEDRVRQRACFVDRRAHPRAFSGD
jgi:anaerobic magnesium-protoporphyrin IX monomethyl ester cyclase